MNNIKIKNFTQYYFMVAMQTLWRNKAELNND